MSISNTKKQKCSNEPSIFPNERDQSEYESLRDTLKICQLLVDITTSIISIIAQYGIGAVVMCDCKQYEILILPSMRNDFMRFHCPDCNDGTCSSMQCVKCTEKSNRWSIEPTRKINESNPMIVCCECVKDGDFTSKCFRCMFICKGCFEYFCRKRHRGSICGKCGEEFCLKQEQDLRVCPDCQESVCGFCRCTHCDIKGKSIWVDVGDLYGICRLCLNKEIMHQYKCPGCYQACRQMLKNLNDCHSLQDIPVNILTQISIYGIRSREMCTDDFCGDYFI